MGMFRRCSNALVQFPERTGFMFPGRLLCALGIFVVCAALADAKYRAKSLRGFY